MGKIWEERERRRKQLIYNSHFAEKSVFAETQKEEKICIHCGIVLDQDALYCKLCGRAIRKSRHISSTVKREVWRRDEGRCVQCGSKERLEFDHIIPFSKGGSNTTRNIELLCERCNRKKTNNI